MELTRHPLSAAWPDMEQDDFNALRDSILDGGQREPIVLLEGMVLDGWQRYRACTAEGIEPKTEEFEGDDPVEFVRDKHTRRPLSLTQRLTCIALMHQRRPRGRVKSANAAELPTAKSLAKQAGGSQRSAESVVTSLKTAGPALVEAMKTGQVAAHRAEQISKLPKREQAKAIAAPAPARAPAANPAPAMPADADRTAQLEDQVATLLDQLAEAREDIASMAKILDANDKVAEALSEAKKSRDLARGYKARIDSMTTQVAELKRLAASWEKKAKAVIA